MEDRQIMGGRWRFCDVVNTTPIEIDYRILSAYDWVGDVSFRVLTEKPNSPPSTTDQPAQVRHSDPWVFGAHLTAEVDARITISLLVDGVVQLSEVIETGVPLNQSTTKTISPTPPRIVRAINTTPIGCPLFTSDQDSNTAVIETPQVKNILDWIWRRIEGGLDPAWLGPDGGRGQSLAEMSLSAEALREEEWARGFAEIATGARYGGAESAWYRFQFNGNTSDGPSTERMASHRNANGGRSWFPLGFACQQLATMGLLLRNHPFSTFQPALNAGGSLGLPVFNTNDGHQYPPSAGVRSPSVGLNAKPQPTRPGTVFEFYDTPNVGGAHIGMVLRVHPNSNGFEAFQTIDTGALNMPGRFSSVNFAGTPTGGVFDDPWLMNSRNAPGPAASKPSATNPKPKPPPFRGTGVPFSSQPLSLSVIRSWWPIGFARLVLRRRSDHKIIYATPMLRMHQGLRGFPMTLLGWSLRGRPYSAAVEAMWQISIPQDSFAREVVEAGSTATMTSLANSRQPDPSKPLTKNLFAFISISTNADDQAHLDAGAATQIGMARPWGIRSKDAGTPDFAPLSEIPAYFRGDEQ